MDSNDLKQFIHATIVQTQFELDLLGKLGQQLPALPQGLGYLSLEPFGLKHFAPYALDLVADDRDAAVWAAGHLFQPAVPLVYFPHQVPMFRPRTIQAYGEATVHQALQARPVAPVLFNVQYSSQFLGGIECVTKLLWYHQLDASNPNSRIIIGVNIFNDATRLTATEATGLPNGNQLLDPEVNEGGWRNAMVFWEDGADWQSQLATAPAGQPLSCHDWPDVIL